MEEETLDIESFVFVFAGKRDKNNRLPFKEVVEYLDFRHYTVIMDEKDYKGVSKYILSLCPRGHECKVMFRKLRKDSTTCCKECGKFKYQDNFIKNHGVSNPMKLKKIKEKIKQTNIERRGVAYPMQDSKIREKAKQTYLKKTGYENPMQNPESIKKSKETYLIRTGYENPAQNPEIREKAKQTYLKKTG